jgi:hypothetical protein
MGVFFLPQLGDIFILQIVVFFCLAVSHTSLPLLEGWTKAGRPLIASKSIFQFLPTSGQASPWDSWHRKAA